MNKFVPWDATEMRVGLPEEISLIKNAELHESQNARVYTTPRKRPINAINNKYRFRINPTR